MEVLSPTQLKGLEKHKYSSSGTSLVEPIFQVYWRWLVELVPRWVAPNTITIVGLIINIVTSLLLMVYCPSATEVSPRWVYLLNAIGLFVYQSLDAIDGKQARRTGSASPLGELFDHGCDSISTVVVSIAVCICMRLGHHPWVMAFICFSAYVAFYCGHWSSYVTGTLFFGIIDVTEVQLGAVLIFLTSFMLGPEIFSSSLPVLGIPLHTIPVMFVFIGCGITFIRFAKLIFNGGCGENGATIAGTSVLSPGLSLFVVLAFGLSIASQSKTQLLQHHPVIYLLFIGLIFAKVTNRLVVAHMTRSELQLLDTSLLGPLILFLNQYFGFLLNEYFLLWLCFILCIADLIRYLSYTYLQIASYLNIYIFSLKLRPKSERNE